MPEITILTEQELRRCAAVDAGAVEIVSGAFSRLAHGGVQMPPVMRLDIAEHNGEVDVKTAYVPGFDGFAIKVSPGFFDNPKLGLASVNGLMILHDSRTGLVRAVMLDNGYLTDVRTAAAGAVAARHLAPERIDTAAVLGAGVQARLQLKALTLVRPVERAVIWARDGEKARACAAELADELGIPVEAVAEAREAVQQARAVITTTPAGSPILHWDWLRPGTHVTAMGSDADGKNEVAPAVLANADRLVVDSRSQCAAMGELHHAIAAGALPSDVQPADLGQVVNGDAPGRQTAEEITVADLTGTGVQDTAIAVHAERRATDLGLGARVQA